MCDEGEIAQGWADVFLAVVGRVAAVLFDRELDGSANGGGEVFKTEGERMPSDNGYKQRDAKIAELTRERDELYDAIQLALCCAAACGNEPDKVAETHPSIAGVLRVLLPFAAPRTRYAIRLDPPQREWLLPAV